MARTIIRNDSALMCVSRIYKIYILAAEPAYYAHSIESLLPLLNFVYIYSLSLRFITPINYHKRKGLYILYMNTCGSRCLLRCFCLSFSFFFPFVLVVLVYNNSSSASFHRTDTMTFVNTRCWYWGKDYSCSRRRIITPWTNCQYCNSSSSLSSFNIRERNRASTF